MDAESELRSKVFILKDDPAWLRVFLEVAENCDVTYVDNVPTATQAFQPPYALMCLDHDLGGECWVPSSRPDTGAAFCRWLPAAEGDQPVVVHSYNAKGGREMVATLSEKGYRVIHVPFGPAVLQMIGAL